MDAGHHNCRDYYVKADDMLSVKSNTVTTASVLATRKSRVSQKSPLNGPSRPPPAFPFLSLPLELRRQVYSYLLPYTEEQKDTRHLFRSITSKRLPPTHTNLPPDVLQQLLARPGAVSTSSGKENAIWRRGQTSLMAVCRQFHNECADLLYGESTFVIFVAYDSITFRFRWLLPNGLSPSRTYEFLDLVPARYLKLLKRLVVTVDHVDSYTGQIKYNVGGKGLTHGLNGQVERLVQAIKVAPTLEEGDKTKAKDHRQKHLGLRRLNVKLLNGNDHLDAEKRNMVKARDASVRGVEEVQTVLQPLRRLKGLVSLEITGSVTDAFVQQLREETVMAR